MDVSGRKATLDTKAPTTLFEYICYFCYLQKLALYYQLDPATYHYLWPT